MLKKIIALHLLEIQDPFQGVVENMDSCFGFKNSRLFFRSSSLAAMELMAVASFIKELTEQGHSWLLLASNLADIFANLFYTYDNNQVAKGNDTVEVELNRDGSPHLYRRKYASRKDFLKSWGLFIPHWISILSKAGLITTGIMGKYEVQGVVKSAIAAFSGFGLTIYYLDYNKKHSIHLSPRIDPSMPELSVQSGGINVEHSRVSRESHLFSPESKVQSYSRVAPVASRTLTLRRQNSSRILGEDPLCGLIRESSKYVIPLGVSALTVTVGTIYESLKGDNEELTPASAVFIFTMMAMLWHFSFYMYLDNRA